MLKRWAITGPSLKCSVLTGETSSILFRQHMWSLACMSENASQASATATGPSPSKGQRPKAGEGLEAQVQYGNGRWCVGGESVCGLGISKGNQKKCVGQASVMMYGFVVCEANVYSAKHVLVYVRWRYGIVSPCERTTYECTLLCGALIYAGRLRVQCSQNEIIVSWLRVQLWFACCNVPCL